MTGSGKKMGGGPGAQHGPKGVGEEAFEEGLKEVDLAQDKMGDNALQGDDQESVRNERRAQPDAAREPDSAVRRSFEMMDKDERARRELGKRRGTHDPDADRGEDAGGESSGGGD